MWPNPQFPADLVTFTEETFNGKLHFLCNDKTCSDHTQTMQLQKDNVKTSAMEETKTQNSIGIY